MSTKRDYYEILGVERTAAVEDVRRAYRQLTRKYHPDVNQGDPEAEERYKEINEAHEVLSDPQRRARYDRFGHDGDQPGLEGFAGAGAFGDIFDMFFGAAGVAGGVRSTGSTRDGRDLRMDVEITLEEAATGVDRTFTLSRQEGCDNCRGTGAKPGTAPQRCPSCNGTGQVRHVQNTILGSFATVVPCTRCRGEGTVVSNPCDSCQGTGRRTTTREKTIHIPAGVDTGTSIQLSGEGDAGTRSGQAGSLYIFVNVREHETFKRRGGDLYCEIAAPYPTMVLGGSITVATLFGSETISVPRGTQPNSTFRLRGKGMPDVNGRRGHGDLYVVVGVYIPTQLGEEQRRLLREYALLSGDAPPEEHSNVKGFISKVMDSFG
jgi:molecular chaperone DnaJ